MAFHGPLPKPADQRRNRNPKVVPTTDLAASGPKGPVPRPPKHLGPIAREWWRKAWRLPQACAWVGGGFESTVERRAELEEQWRDDPSTNICRELLQLDDRLGLSPRAMASLRWRVVPDVDEEPTVGPAKAGSSVRRLRAVDPGAVERA